MSIVKYYTEEGLQRLKDELQQLLSVERPAISQQIAEARDKGDLSENAEYNAAKEAQVLLEAKISKLQEAIMNAKIIDTSKLDASKVLILTTVKIKNLKTSKEMIYTIVPESEADIKQGKLSVSSPIAKALLGRMPGDKVDVKAPVGIIPIEIIEIL